MNNPIVRARDADEAAGGGGELLPAAGPEGSTTGANGVDGAAPAKADPEEQVENNKAVQQRTDKEEEEYLQHAVAQSTFRLLLGPYGARGSPPLDGTALDSTGNKPPCFPGDPRRMVLSEQERTRAKAIKSDVLRVHPDLVDNPIFTDYMFAQMAIVFDNGDGVQSAVDRAESLLAAQEELGLVNDIEQATHMLQTNMTLQSGSYFCLEFQESSQSFVWGCDICAVVGGFENNPEKLRLWLGGYFYFFQGLQCDFAACRNGLISLCECEGYAFKGRDKKGMEPKLYQLFHDQIVEIYPKRHQWSKYFNPSTFLHMLLSLSKVFKTRHYETFGRSEIRLDKLFFLLDTPEQVHTRMLSNLTKWLKIRYDNEKNFKL